MATSSPGASLVHPEPLITNDPDLMVKAKWPRLSVDEQRLILLMLAMISKDDIDFKVYRIRLKDLAHILGIKRTDVCDSIEKATDGLMTKIIRWSDSKLEPLGEHKVTWLSSAAFTKGEGYVEVSFDPKLRPFLLALKRNFNQYELGGVLGLKSYYSLRIYKLLKYHHRLTSTKGTRKIVVTLDWLKYYLGIEESEYTVYGNFKKKVLRPVQEELADRTNLTVTISQSKTGRNVDKLSFQWSYNSDYEDKPPFIDVIALGDEDNEGIAHVDETSLAIQLRVIGVDDREIYKLLNQHVPDVLIAAIADFKTIIQSRGSSIHDHAAYFCSLLPTPGQPYNTPDIAHTIREHKVRKQSRKRLLEIVDILSNLEMEYQANRSELALTKLKAMAAPKQQEHKLRFTETVVNRNLVLRNRLQTEGFESILVQASYEAYLVATLLPSITGDDFARFCRSKGQDLERLLQDRVDLKAIVARKAR
jgi:hypothetical protein